MTMLELDKAKQSKIIRLSPITISRIAAGESVDRPASVVKELIENSLDAGASEIIIRIENTGKGLISVSDNGCGIEKKDLPVAVESHTTSKLKGEDLIHIGHLGFRGEAIASIGAISRLTIRTRTKNSSEGSSISVIGGQVTDLMPVPHHVGTTVEVRDLFYATPARLKFLRKDKTESQHIENVINKIAIAYPKVAFKLYADEKLVLHYSSVDLIDSRAARISEVLGKEFFKNSIEINSSSEEVHLSGYICLPTHARSTYTDQYLYVNNRAVRDKLLLVYVKNAYQDFLSKDKYPMTVLFLDMPAELVDVNVHPTKAEVRFRDVFVIKNLVVGSLTRALEENSPKFSPDINTAAINNAISDTIKPKMSFTANADMDKNRPMKDFGSYKPNSDSQFYDSMHQFNNARTFREKSPSSYTDNIVKQPIEQSFSTIDDIKPSEMRLESSSDIQSQFEEQGELIYESPLFGISKGQIHDSYIISQTKDGIMIIDQYAAYEKICYEKLKKQLKEGNIESQKLLVAEIVELDNLDIQDRILNLKDGLLKSGLKIEYHSKKFIKITEIPNILAKCNIKNLMTKIINNVLNLEDNIKIDSFIDNILAIYACEYRAGAGRRLSPNEIEKLFKELEAIDQNNHSHPTYIELKLKDIKKLFERN